MDFKDIEKLSEGIQIALDDLVECENDSRYILNMGVYHTPLEQKCEVCLAGAIMAQTLDIPIDCRMTVSKIPNKLVRDKLYAMNEIAYNNLRGAIYYWNGGDCGTVLPNYKGASYVHYEQSPEGFKKHLRGVISYLKEHSL